MNVTKMLKKLKANHLAMGLAVLAIAYVLYNYSSSKSNVVSAMSNAGPVHQPACGSQNFKPAQADGQNSGPASAQGAQTSTHGLPASCNSNAPVDPKDLLPKDNNSEFAQMNPMGSGDLMNANLLKAGHHIGINTVGQSLRNANLQLRSEPANPQMKVGPWNNTTIGPDSRRPMEIGCM